MSSSCERNKVVSFTGQSIIWWNYAIIYCSCGSIKMPSVSFKRLPYAQLKGIHVIAMLIAGCSCTHCQKVALVSNDRSRVLILRQCLETFKISTKTADDIPPAPRTTVHVYFHTHTLNPPWQGRFAMNTSLKNGIHRAWAAYIRIRLIGGA